MKRQQTPLPLGRNAGFTLLELVVTLAIGGMIAMVMTGFIGNSMNAYFDQNARATLVDSADTALQHMARDLRRALPNSIRVDGSGRVLELISTLDAVRYRLDPPPTDPTRRLDFTLADSQFNALGQFTGITLPFSSSGERLVIYNLGLPGADAYQNTNVITPAATSFSIIPDGNEAHFTLSSGFRFAWQSPNQRLYLVETPVTYLCDPAAGTVTRYSGYAIQATQPTNGGGAPLSSAARALLTGEVAQCSFTYTSNASQRSSLVTMELTLSDGSGERIRLLHQVHVENSP